MALESNLSRLTEAVELCQDRIDPVVHADARTALDKAGNRLSFSPEATVIAVAGATGAGKSSIFNALSRQAFAQVGVRRPMTTDAMAITFGSLDTTQLVDWLQISQHHVVADNELSGIVLLDLADFDSVEVDHREEFDRLAQVVDQFLWVVDPQKYADAALHERYLRSFASHSDVMTFVLNHVDKLSASELKAIEKDLVRILEDDGIRKPSLFAVSAATGWGIDKLRSHLAKLAKARKALVLRLEADMLVHARAMNSQVGVRAAGTLGKKETSTMTQGCIEAAGVDEIVDAVQVSMARRGRQMTGLPWLGWMNKFRVDPLKRLHLDQFTSKKNKALESPQITRSSRVAHPVAQARIDMAMRTVTSEAVSRLPKPWGLVVSRMVKIQSGRMGDVVDQGVVNTDLGLNEGHSWWKLVRFVQWILFLCVFVGLGWLVLNFVLTSFLRLPEVVIPKIGALPLATWMVLGGILLGVLTAWLSRVGVHLGAKAAGAKARKRLHSSMETVATDLVIAPINEELTRHDSARQILVNILR